MTGKEREEARINIALAFQRGRAKIGVKTSWTAALVVGDQVMALIPYGDPK